MDFHLASKDVNRYQKERASLGPLCMEVTISQTCFWEGLKGRDVGKPVECKCSIVCSVLSWRPSSFRGPEKRASSAIAVCCWLLERTEENLLTMTRGNKNKTPNNRCDFSEQIFIQGKSALKLWDIVKMVSGSITDLHPTLKLGQLLQTLMCDLRRSSGSLSLSLLFCTMRHIIIPTKWGFQF